MLHIKVPATSANMGPGFDCAGIALQMYNELWVEEIENGVEIISKNNKIIPKDDKNLIYSTIKGFYEEEGIAMPGLRLIQKDDIPMTRGLGSSAACIAGGLLAANALSGRNYSLEEIAQRAAKLEGHPDNSNPAASWPTTPCRTSRQTATSRRSTPITRSWPNFPNRTTSRSSTGWPRTPKTF